MASVQTNIRKMGTLLKLKTNKRKHFVLRDDPESMRACLEYYDSEKKFRSGQRAKRSIPVSDCFSINAKTDAKHKYAIALFTKDDCFAVVCDNEEEQKSWLEAMLELRNSNSPNGSSKPLFEHIWPVTVKPRGLGNGKHLSPGPYRLCLTNQSLGFVRLNHEEPDIVFQLASIRRCGHRDAFFFMELGRQSVTGAGELWLQVEDTVIAQNMHEAILSSMKMINSSGEKQPSFRPRSRSSTDKVTKPIAISSHSTRTRENPAFSSATLPKRHNTMTAVDRSPLRSKQSLSPNKGSHGGLRPVSAIPTPGFLLASSPVSELDTFGNSHDAHRSRTDSLESRGSSRGTASSVSADETEQHLADHVPVVSSEAGLNLIHSESEGAAYLDMSPLVKAAKSLVTDTTDYIDMKPAAESTPTVRGGTASSNYMDMAHLTPGHDSYMDMAPGMQRLSEEVYMDVSASKRESSSTENVDVSKSGHDMAYMDMSPAQSTLSTHDSLSETDGGYIDMCVSGSSPLLRDSPSGHLQRVVSYLRDDDQTKFSSEEFPKRASSVGSKSAVSKTKDTYVDMSGNRFSEKKSSSTPHLNDDPMLSPSPASSQHSVRDKHEVNDLLMEITFSSSMQPSVESLEARPRTSSYGSSKDFRSRTSSTSSQGDFRVRTSSFGNEDRQRLGSAGTRDKISRLASYVRHNQKSRNETSGDNHRPRMATICQDSLRPRTSSFGSGDMRPRSSSHGNARLRELKGSSDHSHMSSQESLKRWPRRSSQDSINSTSSDYLDMNTKLGTSPSQALVNNLKRSTEADSDYMSMEPSGKDSCDSDYVPMFAANNKMTTSSAKAIPDSKPKCRSKSNSLEKKGASSNSSTESLSSVGSTEHKGRKRYSKPPSQPDNYMKIETLAPETKDESSDGVDAYISYAPMGSRDSSQVLSTNLEKVTSPIRTELPAAQDSSLRLSSARSQDKSKKKGHEYINLDYSGDKNIREPLWEDEDATNSGGMVQQGNEDSAKSEEKGVTNIRVSVPPLPSYQVAPAASQSPPTAASAVAMTMPVAADSKHSKIKIAPFSPANASGNSSVFTNPASMPNVPSPPVEHISTSPLLPKVPTPMVPPEQRQDSSAESKDEDTPPLDPFQLNAKASKSTGERSPRTPMGIMSSRGSCGSLSGLDNKTVPANLRERSKSNQFLGVLPPNEESSGQLVQKTSLDNVNDEVITYATLDLASSREEMAGSSSSVCDKSRHDSGEELTTPTISYAEIDFENCKPNQGLPKFTM